MRVSNRLLLNASTTYLRLGTTFCLGLFATWYLVGHAGVAGFGLIALASASNGVSLALERAIRLGLVRDLASAIASGQAARVRGCLASALVLCWRISPLLGGVTLAVAAAAYFGLFNTPVSSPGLDGALAILVLAEGIHAATRLVTAPYHQSLFAGQFVAADNLRQIVQRVTYALSAVAVFGWLLRDADLATQLAGFGASRCTIQLLDVVFGVWLAKRRIPALVLDRALFSREEYESIASTVWHSSQVAILMNLNVQFLAVVINIFFGAAYNGLWQIAVQLGGFARMFSESLLTGIAPLSAHLKEEGRSRAIVALMVRSVRYQLGTVLPVVAGLSVYLQPILVLWILGRVEHDPNLIVAGVTPTQATELLVRMTALLFVAQALRASVFGVERMLYGMGHIQRYSWFAKYAVVLTIGIAALLSALTGSPALVPAALIVPYAIYYLVVIPGAARRAAGLKLADLLAESLPRPLLVTAVLTIVLFALKPWFASLTLWGLVLLLAIAGVVYSVLAFALLLLPGERRRLREMAPFGLG